MTGEQKTETGFRLPKKWKTYAVWVMIFLGALLFAFRGTIFESDTRQLTQTELLQKAQQGQVTEVLYKDDTHLIAKLQNDTTRWEVTYPKATATDTFRALSEAKVTVKAEKAKKSLWSSLFTVFIVMVWAWFILNSLVPLARRAITKKLGHAVHGTRPTERFDDVKGLPEVVDELKKFADILQDPDKYIKLGARIPAGVVLYGPPGTGKTLAAKALAGEAGVPYFEVTGSSVRSMWIGRAGQAIRDHFDKARAYPVSIMLFDEGDTIGGRRSSRNEGGDQEHRAMVNELLAQMNPNRKGGKVFVIIATNDPELLDEALTRPGRIDLQLAVLPPDVNGRKAILETHTKDKPLAPDVNLDKYSKGMYGQNGAALETLANNAALEAGSRNADAISDAHFDHALTVMRTGPARKDLVVTQEDKRVTAFHEAGHALCAAVLERLPSPTHVTILAHGRSGGHTFTLPDEEKASRFTSRETAKQQLVMYMGGVAGEKLALNADFTNGAGSDRRKATELAAEMVCSWGMGTYNSAFDANWRTGPHADEVWRQIEALLDEAEHAAILLLLKHKTAFDALVQELLEKETLRTDDLQDYRPAAETPEAFNGLKEEFAKVIDSVEMRAVKRDLPSNGHHPKALSTTSA